MNELDLIRESLQNEIKNPQNYEKLVQQSASNIANLLIMKPLLDTINNKIEQLREKRNLRRNYKKILNSQLIELLKLLDDPNLNESNVLLIEKLIILSLSNSGKLTDELLAYEYLKIAKTLKGSEIVILESAYRKFKDAKLRENLDIDDIYKDLASSSGLRFTELVIENYQSLMSKKLVKQAWDKDSSQISNIDSRYIFTDLGLAFMNYLEIYEKLDK